MIISEESRPRYLRDDGIVELIELKQDLGKLLFKVFDAWNTYLRVRPFCKCGKLLRPSKNVLEKHSKHCKPLLFVLHQLFRIKCGQNPWQQDHHRARDALRGATKKEKVYFDIGSVVE